MFRPEHTIDPINGRRTCRNPRCAYRAAIIFAVLVCAGCSFPIGTGAFRRAADPATVTSTDPLWRLVVIPGGNHSRYPDATGIVRNALQSELQASGRFDVQAADLSIISRSDQLPESAYVDILPVVIQEQRPDIILLCKITEYRPYPPMAIGLQLRLINPFDASTIASIDSVWEAPTQVLEGRPTELPVFSDTSPYATDTGAVAHSPRLFVRAVAAEVAANLMNALPPHLAPTLSPGESPAIESGHSYGSENLPAPPHRPESLPGHPYRSENLPAPPHRPESLPGHPYRSENLPVPPHRPESLPAPPHAYQNLPAGIESRFHAPQPLPVRPRTRLGGCQPLQYCQPLPPCPPLQVWEPLPD